MQKVIKTNLICFLLFSTLVLPCVLANGEDDDDGPDIIDILEFLNLCVYFYRIGEVIGFVNTFIAVLVVIGFVVVLAYMAPEPLNAPPVRRRAPRSNIHTACVLLATADNLGHMSR